MFISATHGIKTCGSGSPRWSPDCRAPHLAVRPAQLDLVHPPQLVDVLRQLVSDFLQVGGHDNLKKGEERKEGLSWFSLGTIHVAFTWLVSTGVGMKEAWDRSWAVPSRSRTPATSLLYSFTGSTFIFSLGSSAS